jgi:hypothetical protein
VIPIAIMVDGRFYDASIYKADPVPMALDPGTVYEVEKSGEPQGLVTLTVAKETAQGAWFADGRYQTNAQLAAAHAPRKSQTNAASEMGGPPKLRRGPAPASTNSEPAPAPATSEPARDESGRPILRRGRPSAEQADALPGRVSTKPGTPAAAPGKMAPAAVSHVLPAISDAGGPQPHSYGFDWSPQEKQRLTSAVETLASAALADYARAHPGARPGKLENAQVQVFDLDYNNSPDLVLSASAREAAAPAVTERPRRGTAGGMNSAATQAAAITYWVTVVAREDLNGDLRKLKAWVTDSKHLDAFPRVELIDAVDADGNGRGELLFREISDIGRNYVIYRVTPDYLTALFNSAELEQ